MNPVPVRIRLGAHAADPTTRIEVGGVDLTGRVRSVAINAGAGEATVVYLTIDPDAVDVVGRFDRLVSDSGLLTELTGIEGTPV